MAYFGQHFPLTQSFCGNNLNLLKLLHTFLNGDSQVGSLPIHNADGLLMRLQAHARYDQHILPPNKICEQIDPFLIGTDLANGSFERYRNPFGGLAVTVQHKALNCTRWFPFVGSGYRHSQDEYKQD